VGAERPEVVSVTHRGIRWQRAASGRMRWWNDDLGRWVNFRPGADAPPRPPGWEAPPKPVLARPKWRSPYRIVPIVVVAVVVVVGLVQALRSNQPVTSAIKQAAALQGKCLRQTGTVHGSPAYSRAPVPCGVPDAAVKVVAVVANPAGSPGSGSLRPCPPGSALAQLVCVAPVKH